MPLYFLLSQKDRAIKIGYSSTPTGCMRRARAARTYNSVPPVLLGVMARADRNTDRAVRAEFKHLRIRGEWFRANNELLGFVYDNAKPVARVSQFGGLDPRHRVIQHSEAVALLRGERPKQEHGSAWEVVDDRAGELRVVANETDCRTRRGAPRAECKFTFYWRRDRRFYRRGDTAQLRGIGITKGQWNPFEAKRLMFERMGACMDALDVRLFGGARSHGVRP